MKIATWNVNSIKVRLPALLAWIDEAKPDVLLLQEIKCVDKDFPALEIQAKGYQVAVHGQKTYNGVAILSKLPLSDIKTGLPKGEGDDHARWIEATASGVRVVSLYLPNGNPAPGEKYDYKLAWMRRLIDHGRALLQTDMPVVLGGDYNVCPTDADVYDPKAWRDDALCRPESRARFRELLYLGYTEAFHALHPDAKEAYSFWDYQAGAWDRGNGLRIDHLLLSPQAADRLRACDIDKGPRGKDKPSDHTPVWCELT
ncbi:MAG TPA: exodeoxyribonuclease III [Magnetospirillaceae bacterium]|jgi:exodeoxyribonuclease-3